MYIDMEGILLSLFLKFSYWVPVSVEYLKHFTLTGDARYGGTSFIAAYSAIWLGEKWVSDVFKGKRFHLRLKARGNFAEFHRGFN